MNIDLLIRNEVVKALHTIYSADIESAAVQTQMTRKEFEGDITVVVFPFTKISRKGPEQTAAEIGDYLVEKVEMIDRYNVVKGFLNLVVSQSYWLGVLEQINANEQFGYISANDSSELVMVEYSSPNTNKPLHLGHIRNNLLGFSISEIM